MASCSGARYYSGISTPCGSGQMSWAASLTVNETAFSHDPSNASRAQISFSASYTTNWYDGSWADPSAQNYASVFYKSSQENWVRKIGQWVSRWTGCGNYSRTVTGNPTGIISSTDTSVRFGSWMGVPSDTPTESDMQNYGECILSINLPTNYRILPPKGLSTEIISFTQTEVSTAASITSWSDNTNIVGTPYTQGGGRTWNFMAEIRTAPSASSTTIKRIELNTGETKNATFNFTELNLAQGTTYWIRYVVSNDYQQIQEEWASFVIPIPKKENKFYGSVTEASTRIIKFYGPVSNKATSVIKIYGSVNDKAKRFF